MSDIKIRKIKLSELHILQHLSKTTFLEAYADNNTKENMRLYLATSFSQEQLLKELNQAKSEFYFAEMENKIVAYLKLNHGKAQTEQHNFKGLEVERIYVLQAFQRQKIGLALLKKATQIAQNKALDYVWLGVWEENVKARKFYEKNGFAAFGKHIFRFGTENQTDIMMRIKVKK